MRIKIGDTYEYENFLGKPARVTVTDISLELIRGEMGHATAAYVAVKYQTGKTKRFGAVKFAEFLADEMAVKVEEAQQ